MKWLRKMRKEQEWSEAGGQRSGVEYIWQEMTREVRGYEGLYGVSTRGYVYNLRTGCALEPVRGAYVSLSKEGKVTTYRVADLVALEWVKNPWRKPYVVHKDGDVTNNDARNLEWSEVDDRKNRALIRKDRRKVLQLDMMGGLVAKYDSVSDASLVTGVDKGSISRCCRGSYESSGGFKWQFEELEFGPKIKERIDVSGDVWKDRRRKK